MISAGERGYYERRGRCARLFCCCCSGDDDDDDFGNDNTSAQRGIIIFVVLVLLVGFGAYFVASTYEFTHTGRLWTERNEQRHDRSYCLKHYTGVPGAPMALGYIDLNANTRVVEVDLYVENVPNVTTVHLYGPVKPGMPFAPVALPITSDIDSQYVWYGTSGKFFARAMALESNDIVEVMDSSVFFYVGISSHEYNHGSALRLFLSSECRVKHGKNRSLF
jgi:hypothetical protein